MPITVSHEYANFVVYDSFIIRECAVIISCAGAAGGNATPLVPIPYPDQAYHEAIAQQMKMFHLQKESMAATMGGGMADSGVPPGANVQNMMGVMYQNPMAMQQLMWLNSTQQQRAQQQMQACRRYMYVCMYTCK